MKKNKITLCSLALIMSISLYGCSKTNVTTKINTEEPENVYVSAKTDAYTTIEELEKASDLIVIGTKIKEIKSDVLYDEQGIFQIAYTYSDFQIDEVISNKVNETKEKITIFENQALDKKENKILHIAGYTNMIVNNQYILYLELTDEDYYVPLAATAGKIAMNNSEINCSKIKMKNFDNRANEEIESLHQKVQNKYKDKIK